MIIRKSLKKLYCLFSRNEPFFYKGITKTDLLIYDDIFPHPVSGFRLEEFTILLFSFTNSKIIVNPTAYPVVGTPADKHKIHMHDFLNRNQALKNKVIPVSKFVNINTKLFYCVFINTIFSQLPWIEKYKIPFVFTLYPGGGFQLNTTESDSKLRKVFGSPYFRHVIVTQKITREYLVDNNFCKAEQITYIFGVVIPQISLDLNLVHQEKYLLNKESFDICFCAAKYCARGEDKGYDVFIECAEKLVQKYDFIRFHVIGGFSQQDIDISKIKDKITFYGYQDYDALGSIFKKMDVLISPNKAFVLSKGAFDGFPLGTVIEAALNGVVVMITDELNQNEGFIEDVDMILINSESESIVVEIEKLIAYPTKMKDIARTGKEKFKEVYSNKVQMTDRITVLKNEIESMKS